MTPEQERREEQYVARGEQARRLLEDKLFLGAAAALQADIWDQFKEADASDALMLQRIKLREDVLTEFLNLFRRHVETGTIARSNLRKWRDRFTRKKR